MKLPYAVSPSDVNDALIVSRMQNGVSKMQLSLPEDSVPVKEMFERFFASESTPGLHADVLCSITHGRQYSSP